MSELQNKNTQAESALRDVLTKDADNWESRKLLANLLYDDGKTAEAAEVVWDAPAIPSIDLELGFAIKVLGKGAPRKAIRLLSSIQELNKGKPAQNLGLANALMHYGMVMEAARFYGAAIAESGDLASADLEHFLLWTDDNEKIWGDFKEEKPTLGTLPWMKRDAKEAQLLTQTARIHTTPVKISHLKEVDTEKVAHEMYVQSKEPGSEPTPPPAVSIPMDRVNPKDVLIDPERGAAAPEKAAAPAAAKPAAQITPAPISPKPPSKMIKPPAADKPMTSGAKLLPPGTKPVPTGNKPALPPMKPKQP